MAVLQPLISTGFTLAQSLEVAAVNSVELFELET